MSKAKLIREIRENLRKGAAFEAESKLHIANARILELEAKLAKLAKAKRK